MGGIKELGDCKVVRDIKDTCSNGRGHCGDEGTLAEAIANFPSNPSNTALREKSQRPRYKSSRETTQFSSIPLLS